MTESAPEKQPRRIIDQLEDAMSTWCPVGAALVLGPAAGGAIPGDALPTPIAFAAGGALGAAVCYVLVGIVFLVINPKRDRKKKASS